MNIQRLVVFGATSAIAQAVARQFALDGASIYCIGRNAAKLDSLLADLRVRAKEPQKIAGESANLDDFERHEALFAAAEKALGGIDAVLIAQGHLPDQKSCEKSVPLMLQEIHLNALSVLSLATLAANILETQKRGVLAVISSVAGDRGRQSLYVYCSAKAMINVFMQGLRHRLTKSGIAVVTVKPGFVDTPMTAGFRKSALWATPDGIAGAIVDAMIKGKGDIYVPGFWRWIMLIVKHIPDVIFNRMKL